MANLQVITRPHYGTYGNEISLKANHFQLKFSRRPTLVHIYEIELTQKRHRLNRRQRCEAFWQIVEKCPHIFGSCRSGLVFDGHRFIVSAIKINLNWTNKTTFFINTNISGATAVRLICSTTFKCSQRIDSCISSDNDALSRDEIITMILRCGRIFDIRKNQPNKLLVHNNNKLYFEHTADDPSKLLRNGRLVQEGISLDMCDVDGGASHVIINNVLGVFYQPLHCIDFCSALLRRPIVNQGLTSAQLQCLRSEFTGLSIHVDSSTIGTAKGIFIIRGLSQHAAKSLMFPLKSHCGSAKRETMVSVESYFSERYKVNLNSIDKIITLSCIRAPDRRRKIMGFIDDAGLSDDACITEFGIRVGLVFVEVKGRLLPHPALQYSTPAHKPWLIDPRSATWIPNKNYYNPMRAHQSARCRSWGLVSFLDIGYCDIINAFCHDLVWYCCTFGLEAMPKSACAVTFIVNKYNVPGQLTRAFEKCCQAAEVKKSTCDLIFVVLEEKNSPHYCDVKRIAELQVGVMTQCMTGKVVKSTRTRQEVMYSLALKIIAKLGGINQKLAQDEWCIPMYGRPALILGVDVKCVKNDKNESIAIASVVGSTDINAHTYQASTIVQKFRRDKTVNIFGAVRERLHSFVLLTGMKPKRIIVYRDGVSRNKYRQMVRQEVFAIKKACCSFEEDYNPPITFVAIDRSHNTRLFPTMAKHASGMGHNMPPGTVVDRWITDCKYFDFFLCSHFVKQGTARPTHYCVLYDDNSFTANQIQVLTYYLTYIYARCPRAVSIPAPAYYAVLSSMRSQCHLESLRMLYGKEFTNIDNLSVVQTNLQVLEMIQQTMYFI